MNVSDANHGSVALGTTLSIRQLQVIAIKAKSEQRTVARVIRGEQLSRDTHKQAAIIKIVKRLHPTLMIPNSTGTEHA